MVIVVKTLAEREESEPLKVRRSVLVRATTKVMAEGVHRCVCGQVSKFM